MILFDYTKPKMIVAEKGKKIREVKDVYIEQYTDEEGNIVPEHIPYYATTIFVPDNFTEEQMRQQYIEENAEV